MEANEVFESAIYFERRNCWRKAARKYEELIALLFAQKIDGKHSAYSNINMLIYECHLHCGVAYQHLEQVSIAMTHFVSAMKTVSRKKIGCCAGCITGKVFHLHVPALAKIAICHIQQGEYETALKTIEQALVLDFKNPELFCIRACSYFLLGNNRQRAIKDVNYAIWLSPKHACAWLLRGTFKECKRDEMLQERRENVHIEMACRLDTSTLAYTHIKQFPTVAHKILIRFLPSLRISHTVSPSDVPALRRKILEDRAELKKESSNETNQAKLRIIAKEPAIKTQKLLGTFEEKRGKHVPFICGMSSSNFHRLSFSSTFSRETKAEVCREVMKAKFRPLAHDESSLTLASLRMPGEETADHSATSIKTLTKCAHFGDTSSSGLTSLSRAKRTGPITSVKNKTLRHSNELKVGDLLTVQPEYQRKNCQILKIPNHRDCGNMGKSEPFQVMDSKSLVEKDWSLKIRRMKQEQERPYPRFWTQNQYPVQIPDVRGCRSISDLEKL